MSDWFSRTTQRLNGTWPLIAAAVGLTVLAGTVSYRILARDKSQTEEVSQLQGLGIKAAGAPRRQRELLVTTSSPFLTDPSTPALATLPAPGSDRMSSPRLMLGAVQASPITETEGVRSILCQSAAQSAPGRKSSVRHAADEDSRTTSRILFGDRDLALEQVEIRSGGFPSALPTGEVRHGALDEASREDGGTDMHAHMDQQFQFLRSPTNGPVALEKGVSYLGQSQTIIPSLGTIRSITDSLSSDAVASIFLILVLHAMLTCASLLAFILPEAIPYLDGIIVVLQNPRVWERVAVVSQPLLLILLGVALARISMRTSAADHSVSKFEPSARRFAIRDIVEQQVEPEVQQHVHDIAAVPGGTNLQPHVLKGMLPVASPGGEDPVPATSRREERRGEASRSTPQGGIPADFISSMRTPDPQMLALDGLIQPHAPNYDDCEANLEESWTRSVQAFMRILQTVDALMANSASMSTFTAGYAEADSLAIECLAHFGFVYATGYGFIRGGELTLQNGGIDAGTAPDPFMDVSSPPIPVPPSITGAQAAKTMLNMSTHEFLCGHAAAAVLALAETLPPLRSDPDGILASNACEFDQAGRECFIARACAALLWRRGRVAHIRGNLLATGNLSQVSDSVGFACLTSCASSKHAALAVFRRGLLCVRSSLALHERSADAHKFAVILLSKCDGGDTRARIGGAHALKVHAIRALSLCQSDPILHHILGVWYYEVAGLGWTARQLATTFYGAPPTGTYSEALAHLLEAEDMCVSGRGKGSDGVPVTPWMTNRLKIAQCQAASGNIAEARQWLMAARQLTPGPTEDETAAEQAATLARQLGMPP